MLKNVEICRQYLWYYLLVYCSMFVFRIFIFNYFTAHWFQVMPELCVIYMIYIFIIYFYIVLCCCLLVISFII